METWSIGTVRKSRLLNKKMPPDKKMEKEERGFCVEMVATINEVDIPHTQWQDNKNNQNLLKTYLLPVLRDLIKIQEL